MRVLSTFSGISAASAAWKPLGFEFVGYADIDPFAAHALHHRCGAGRPIYMPSPDERGIDDKEARSRRNAIRAVSKLPSEGVPNFGDISQISDDDLRKIGRVDVLEGGSPCQSFSVAGRRLGLDDARGNLMLVLCELAERMREINGLKYVVWENVKGVYSDKSNGFGCLLSALAGIPGNALQPAGNKWPDSGYVAGIEQRKIAWRTLDAQYFGVPQRRKRCFLVASFGSGCPGEILFEQESLRGDSHASGPSREATAGRPGAGSQGKSVYGIIDDESVSTDLMPTITARKSSGGMAPAVCYGFQSGVTYANFSKDVSPTFVTSGKPAVAFAAAFSAGNSDKARGIGYEEEIAPTLRAGESGSNQRPTALIKLSANDNASAEWVIRRLTPVECERLQGFPDGWTSVPYRGGNLAADGPRYKALGNSMAVPCMRFIGEQLKAVASVDVNVDQAA